MPGTIEIVPEEPLRPTLNEGPPPTVPSDELDPPPSPPRAPMSRGMRIAIGLSIGAAAILVGIVALYLFVIRYEPRAQRHIPGNANLAVRMELVDLVRFGPVKKHLVPTLMDVQQGSSIARLSATTGIDFKHDIREVVIASTDAKSWVIVFGGKIKRGTFLHGFEIVMKEHARTDWVREGDLFIGPHGFAVGQADDGSIVLGTDKAIATAALPSSDEYVRFGFDPGASVTFGITRDAWSGAEGSLGNLVSNATGLRKIASAHGTLSLTDDPQLRMVIVPEQEVDPKALAADVDQILAALRVATIMASDFAGAKRALGVANVKAVGPDVVVTASWPYDALDREAEDIAKRLGL